MTAYAMRCVSGDQSGLLSRFVPRLRHGSPIFRTVGLTRSLTTCFPMCRGLAGRSIGGEEEKGEESKGEEQVRGSHGSIAYM